MMISSNNVSNRGDRVSGFEIKHFKALNPLLLMVKLLILTLTSYRIVKNRNKNDDINEFSNPTL